MAYLEEDHLMEATLWLTILLTVPGAVVSSLQIYEWIKDHRKKRK